MILTKGKKPWPTSHIASILFVFVIVWQSPPSSERCYVFPMRSVETRQLLIYFGYLTVEPRQLVNLGLSNPDNPYLDMSDNIIFCHRESV